MKHDSIVQEQLPRICEIWDTFTAYQQQLLQEVALSLAANSTDAQRYRVIRSCSYVGLATKESVNVEVVGSNFDPARLDKAIDELCE